MRAWARQVRPGRGGPWPALAWAVGFALIATVVPPAEVGSAATPQPVAVAVAPRVSDPRPPPGSVVQAGPVVIAADVQGAEPGDVTLLIDGEPAQGLAADPDGTLSPLDGIEVTLSPGPHQVAVAVGSHGVLREWEVLASGLDIQIAQEDAAGLARRLQPEVRGRDRVVLVDLTQPGLAIAASPIAALLDAVVLPTDAGAVPSPTWGALRTMIAEGPVEVVLLGGDSVVQPTVEEQLRAAGFTTARIAGDTAAQIAAAGADHAASREPDDARALVVGPAEPFEQALTAAVAAARSRAAFVLVDDVLADDVMADDVLADDVLADDVMADDGLDADTAAVIARHQAVLLSSELSEAAREAVIAAMDPAAVASDDDLAPPAARDAVVVSDDTDTARALMASLAVAPGRAVTFGDAAATRWVGLHRPDRVTLVGGPADALTLPAPVTTPAGLQLPAIATTPALDPNAPAVETLASRGPATTTDLAPALRSAWVDGPDRPLIGALIDPTDGLRIALTAAEQITDAAVHVTLLGYEWPGSVVIDGLDATWTGEDRPALPLPLEPAGIDTPTPVDVTVAMVVGGRSVHQRFTTDVAISPLPTASPEGWIVAGGSNGTTGETGLLYTYSVEVEPQTGLDIAEVEAEITSILTDPRSWTADGAVRFRRVGSSRATLRVVVATPATVDAFCGAAGLRTGGRVSCWDGRRAMLNLDRWTTGVPHFAGDLVTYRQYLVNHEVGHGLTHGHEGCPRPGMLAPIMMQQTGGVGACQPNGWPFP